MQGPGFMQKSNESKPKEIETVEEIFLPTTEINGLVSADLSADSDKVQIISASNNSAVAGSQVSFPPGSIAIATTISIGLGDSLITDLGEGGLDLGTDITASANPVSVSSSVSIDATQPFTISLSIPDSTGLRLQDAFENLIVLYRVDKHAAGGAFKGVIPRDSFVVKNGYAQVSTIHFGTFQAVFTKSVVTNAFETPAPQKIAEEPVVKEPEKEEPLPTKVRFYYVRGFSSVSFGDDRSSVDDYQGWAHHLSRGTVGTDTTIEHGKVTGLKVGN